ncbi:MAG: hypothetical protein N3F07_02120 [Candidatus Micrarchaeota archaeon]|nr:hypothetical protein [Candidatus Micrarchaeota archaeon]
MRLAQDLKSDAMRRKAIKELVCFLKCGSLYNAYAVMRSFWITKKEIAEENSRVGKPLADKAIEEFYNYCGKQRQREFSRKKS